MVKMSRSPLKYLAIILVILLSITTVAPFIYMVLVSMTQKTILDLNFNFAEFSLASYRMIFKNLNIMTNFKNSAIVTIAGCVLNCIFASTAAYAFAKLNFPFRKQLFAIFMATMMIPGQVTLIPVFTIMRKLNWLNTYHALYLPIINAFGVFLIRQFIVEIPDDLSDAARIDGCGENKLFIKIILPLIKPVLVSLSIFTFITIWNDFLWPLVISTKPQMHTLTLAISALKGNYKTNYGLVMAGASLAFLPPFTLYMILQKQFIEGIALSGIKG